MEIGYDTSSMIKWEDAHYYYERLFSKTKNRLPIYRRYSKNSKSMSAVCGITKLCGKTNCVIEKNN